MTPVAPLPDAVTSLLRAADANALLRDAEGLAEVLTASDWTPEIESGRFAADGWDLLSSAWAPNVSVFFDGAAHAVREAARAVAAAIKAEPNRWTFDSEGPDWSTWAVDDPRWDEDEIDWLVWEGPDVVVSLFTAGETPAGPGTLPSHLHLAIDHFERLTHRDVGEILPAVLPDPIPIGSQREFVRQVLSDERSLRADGARFVQQAQEPARSLEQRMYLNADGSPSEQVAAGYRWRAGTELQRAA